MYQVLAKSKIRNAKVSVVSFDNTKGALGGYSVKNITSYHSFFEFLEKGTKMWQYYGIGAGMFEPHSEKRVLHCQENLFIVLQMDK